MFWIHNSTIKVQILFLVIFMSLFFNFSLQFIIDVFVYFSFALFKFHILCWIWSFYWNKRSLFFINIRNFFNVFIISIFVFWNSYFKFNVSFIYFWMICFRIINCELKLLFWYFVNYNVNCRFWYFQLCSSLFNRIHEWRSSFNSIYVIFITFYGFYVNFSNCW